MKKSITMALVMLILFGTALMPAESKPKAKQQPKKKQAAVFRRTPDPGPSDPKKVGVKLGVAMSYDWWQPAFTKIDSGVIGNVKAKNNSTDYAGSFMMGPTLWIGIGRTWNVGLTALFGLTKNEFSYSTLGVDANLLYLSIPENFLSIYYEKGVSRARRYEAEVDVEYRFHKFFNLLFGARFNYADGSGGAMRYSSLDVPLSTINREFNIWYVGPHLGVGFSYDIKGFSINIGLLALIQGGNYYCKKSFLVPMNMIWMFAYMPDEFALANLAMGGEANMKLAYFIERIRVEFWIGGVYRILPHIALYDAGSAYNLAYNRGWITGELEQYGGINFGVAYKF